MPIQTRMEFRNQPRKEVGMDVEGLEGSPLPGQKMTFDENDEKIIAATLKAFESGTLTPLIKEELRCTIQSRRIAEGKGEMQVEFKTPARKKEMTDDERTRALKRRQQNREAAQRFRQRQKDTSDYLSAKIRRLEKSANSLVENMNRLKEEKELLGQMLKDHLTVCSNPNVAALDHTLNSNSSSSNGNIQTTLPSTSTPPPPAQSSSCSIPSPSLLKSSCHHHLYNISSSNASVSSVDSNFTCFDDYTPNTAASDTSVFFPDEAVSPASDDQNYTFASNTLTPTAAYLDDPCESDNITLPNSSSTALSPENDNIIIYDDLKNANANSENLVIYQDEKIYGQNADNVVIYRGSLDACYEEIIIDFAHADADYLHESEARTRGDSCSSVDTVSSHQAHDLNSLSESTFDLRHSITSAYSQIQNLSTPGGFNATVPTATDFLLLGDANS